MPSDADRKETPVATSAPDRDSSHQQGQFEDRTRRAWVAYRDSLKDLTGPDYDEAEHRSWERLQRRLAELEGERAAGGVPGAVADGDR
jgi:hypothetical protein